MNSSLLKKLHPEVYRKFFNENGIVVSLPITMNRSLAWSWTKWLFAKQKVPLRVYFWVNTTSDHNEIKCKNITSYNFEEWLFSTNNWNSKESDLHVIQNQIAFLISKDIQLSGKWVNIDILMETWSKYDLGFIWVLALWITLISNYYIWRINTESIIKESKWDINIIRYNDSIWKVLEQVSIAISKINWRFWSSAIVCSFFQWNSHFLTFKDKTTPHKYPLSDVHNIHTFKTDELANRISSLWEVYISTAWSFDHVIIYSWIPIQENKQYPYDVWLFGNMGKTKQEMQKYLNLYNLDWAGSEAIESFGQLEMGSMIEAHRIIADAINLEIQYSLIELMGHKFKVSALDTLIESVNKVSKLFSIFCDHGKKFLKLIRYTENYCNAQDNEVWVFPFDIIQWGWCISFISPLESNRKKINQMVSDYKLSHPDSYMSIIYESRKDGLEFEWVKIEQNLSEWIFSPCISGSKYLIEHYDGSIELINSSEDGLLSTQDDIVIDSIAGKIYVQGNKITSADLHSQTTTCEVLIVALKNLWTEFSNAKLQASSYSRNKNEMISKVITPLKALVEKYLDKKIDMTCSWSISYYHMRLNPSKVRFAIIRRIEELITQS